MKTLSEVSTRVIETLFTQFGSRNNNLSSPVNSTILNQTTCDPILFQLGPLSREQSPTLEYGLCPGE